MNKRKEERNQKALELRHKGMYYKDIAKELGLSYTRTWTIVNNQERWNNEGKEAE